MNAELNPLDEFYFQWHITERCNKHCRHCYQNDHPTEDLPLAKLGLVLDRMEEAQWNGEPFFYLFWGAPLHPSQVQPN